MRRCLCASIPALLAGALAVALPSAAFAQAQPAPAPAAPPATSAVTGTLEVTVTYKGK